MSEQRGITKPRLTNAQTVSEDRQSQSHRADVQPASIPTPLKMGIWLDKLQDCSMLKF